MARLQPQLIDHQVHNDGETRGWGDPVLTSRSRRLPRIQTVHDRDEEAHGAVPQAQDNPFPKHLIVEEEAQLTWFVDLGVSERVVEIDIFFEQ